MKFRSILAIAALAVFSFTACEETENLGEAKVSVSPAEVTFDATGEKSEVVALTATRDWHIENKPDWVVVNPSTGKASTGEQSVTISVDPNKGNDREDDVIFTIGLAKASLHVKQAGEAGELKKGSGTLEDPYSVAGVIEYVQSLGADVQSPSSVYVKGIVSSVTTTYEASGTYGNAVFYMVDNEGDTDQFYAYQTLYLGNRKWTKGDTDIKAGDAVIIYGPVVNFKGNTPETVSKGASYLYSLNGVTQGTAEPEDPTKVEQITCAEFIEKADPNTTYRLVGKVTSSVNATYCSFDMNDGTETVVVWTVNNKDEWKDKVKQGGTVTVRGKYMKYEQNGNVKHEMVDAYIEKFEEGATVDYDNAPAKTIAEFITAADKTTYYKLTGVVSGFNSNYCSMDITDASGTIYVYSVANKADWASKISNGGTVVLAGQYDYYASKSQHEVVNAYILSFTEGQGGGDAKGTGTLEDPFNADGAAAYIKANGDKESTDDVYVKGKISSVKNTFDAEHGTAIFNISEDGSATATQFTAYSVLYLGNRNWEDGDAQIKVGDEVVLCGKVTNFNGTYETSSKKAYIYSLNGKTSIEQSAAFGVEKTEITVGAAATSATINVTGNVKWTATSEKATVNPASGEGKGAITVSFDANTDTENAKTYTVVVSTTEEVATKSYTVTITQGKASAGGESVEINISFAELPVANFPSGSSAGIKDGTYTISGYEFVFHANDKFYWNTDGYFLIGKKDSYILLPAVSGKSLTSVAFKTGANASENVIIDIYNADGTSSLSVNSEKIKKGTDYSWTVAGQADTKYQIRVTNAFNAQFQSIVLKYE